MNTPFNSEEYVTVPDVPILDEHVLTARDGDVEAVVDAAFLEDVADNCNARFAATGDAVPLVIGHTKADAAETEQPPIVGYATDFKVGDFGGTGRQAIYATFHVRREREAVLRDYPRRSVELWVRKREIDPISLLGATTPERDLGILRYNRRSDSSTLHYRRECPSMPMPKQYASDADAAMKDAEKNETSEVRELSSKFDKLMQMLAPLMQALNESPEGEPEGEEKEMDAADADEGVGEGAVEDGETQPADESADDDLLGPDDSEGEDADADAESDPESKEAAKFRDNPVRFGSAGGNSTYLPKVTKMARKDDDVVKLQRQHDATKRELAEFKRKYSRMEAEKTIAELEAQGYQFSDRNEEIDIISQFDDEKVKSKFIEKIKRDYRREAVAVGSNDLFRYSRESVGEEPTSADAFYAAFNGGKRLSKDEAEQKLFGSKK